MCLCLCLCFCARPYYSEITCRCSYHSNESSLTGILHTAVPDVEGLMAVNKCMSDIPRRPGHSGLASVIEFLSHPNFVVNDILDTRNSL